MAVRDAFEEHRRVLEHAVASLPAALELAVQCVQQAYGRGHKVLVFGNGGSAADAQHLAAELVCRFRQDRRAVPAIALTTDSSALTAIANDYGYDCVFSRQIEALAQAGDVVFAISTSGDSPNVVKAAEAARARGCTVIALTGRTGGALAAHAHQLIAVPSSVVARIQELHTLCIHSIVGEIEAALVAEQVTA